jgi:hypothetical protein
MEATIITETVNPITLELEGYDDVIAFVEDLAKQLNEEEQD